MKRYISVVFTLTVFLLAGSPSYGDDTADFFTVSMPPNIIFIFDNSSAMFTLPCNDSYDFGNQGCTAEELQSVGYDPSTTYGDWDPDDKQLYINKANGTQKLTPSEDNYALGSVYYQGDYQSRWRKMAESHADFCTTVSTTQDCPGILGEKGYYKKTSGGNQGYYFTGNFLRLYPPKFVAARKVLKDVVMDTKEIRMAVVVFEDGTDPWGGVVFDDLNPPCSKFPVDPENPPDWTSNRQSIVNKLRDSSLTFDDGPATKYHYAPLAETLLNAGQYYAIPDHFLTLFGSDYVKGEFDSLNNNNQDSVCFGCQKSYVIIITGGIPTKDQNIPDEIGDYDKDSNEPTGDECKELLGSGGPTTANPFWRLYEECRDNDGSAYVDDVAMYLEDKDLRPDEACCPSDCESKIDSRTCGTQNVVTYVVGFAADHPLLQETAENGDGLYLTAKNAEELAEKLREAIEDILRRSVSFTVPAVPAAKVTDLQETTGLSSDDKIYLASFKPTKKGLYEGHLRAYYFDCKSNIFGGENCDPEQCKDEIEENCKDDTDPLCPCDLSKCSGCVPATDAEGNVTDADGNPIAPPVWDAGEVLRDKPADERKIYTAVDLNGDGVLESEERIEFSTSIAGGPLTLLRAALNLNDVNTDDLNGDGQITDADADLLIEFVRGKDSLDYDGDGNKTEDRSWKLGDIFHSSPVLVGHPNPMGHYFGFTCDHLPGYQYGYADTTTDPDRPRAFRHSREIMLRPKMLVVGANDGMLHCFNVGEAVEYESGEADDPETCRREDLKEVKDIKWDKGTGEEMWGFIPPNLLPKLKDMIHSHQYYVDATPVVADVWIDQEPFTYLIGNMNPKRQKKEWRTVVTCGEREGGRHYFALDITYPDGDSDDDSYECPKFLWEFTDPKMGFTWSEALHGSEYGRIKFREGGNNIDRWMAMMGGGLSPRDEEDVDLEPDTGNAFFVVDIATGKKVWEYSYDPNVVDDRQFMTYDIPSTATPVIFNFANDFSLDDPTNWFMYWVYIGDLGGQMWKLALNQGLDESSMLIPGDFDRMNVEVSGWSGKMFFQADTNISDQPIYFRPSKMEGFRNNLWVYFGTGDRNNPKVLKDSQGRDISNRFYGIMDFGEDSSGNRIQPSLPFHEDNLTDVTNPAVTPVNDPVQSDGQGWYIRLAGQQEYDGENHMAEKVLAKSDTLWGKVYFTTYAPEQEVDDPCLAGVAGKARLYVVSFESGAAKGGFPGGGRSVDTGAGIPSPVIITAQVVDGKIILTALVATSSGGVNPTEVPGPPKPCGILSWKEVFNE